MKVRILILKNFYFENPKNKKINFQAARDFSNDRFVTGEFTDVHEIDNV